MRQLIALAKRYGRRSSTLRDAWGQARWYTSRPGRDRLMQLLRYAGRGRTCPYCGWQGRMFHPTAEHTRPDAQCPRCYAKERHRALYFYLEQLRHSLQPHSRVLEIAPELHSLRYWKDRLHVTYVGLDLYAPIAQIRADILALPAADGVFDLIICLHVLEHIPDDSGAIRELRRVLHPAGRLLIQVPIDREVTFEDPAATDPAKRERLFGQSDHVRAYGWDLVDRLDAAHFDVAVEDITVQLTAAQRRGAGVVAGETIFVCTPGIANRLPAEHLLTRV